MDHNNTNTKHSTVHERNTLGGAPTVPPHPAHSLFSILLCSSLFFSVLLCSSLFFLFSPALKFPDPGSQAREPLLHEKSFTLWYPLHCSHVPSGPSALGGGACVVQGMLKG